MQLWFCFSRTDATNKLLLIRELYMLDSVFLIAGFVPLLYGANILVESASSLAKRYDIPAIVIGLTIVAFGTSSPELAVNLFASFSGNTDISLGNIAGSNIFNILGILGISGIIYPLKVKSNTTWIEIPLCLLSAAALFVLANDAAIDSSPVSAVSRVDGFLLLFFFLIFMGYSFQLMKSGNFDDNMTVKSYSVSKSVILIIAGLALLVAGGRLIVFFSGNLAREIGVPERIIAITIVSIGTSLPELATSAVAAARKNADIAIGNIVGSNIFNTFFILGISAVIKPIPVQRESNLDLAVNIVSGLLLFLFIFTGRGRALERWEGALLVLLYLSYVFSLIIV